MLDMYPQKLVQMVTNDILLHIYAK